MKYKHILTRKQAVRIGLQPFDEVEVTLYKDEELPPSNRGKNLRMAKDVYFNGERIGGTLDLTNDD